MDRHLIVVCILLVGSLVPQFEAVRYGFDAFPYYQYSFPNAFLGQGTRVIAEEPVVTENVQSEAAAGLLPTGHQIQFPRSLPAGLNHSSTNPTYLPYSLINPQTLGRTVGSQPPVSFPSFSERTFFVRGSSLDDYLLNYGVEDSYTDYVSHVVAENLARQLPIANFLSGIVNQQGQDQVNFQQPNVPAQNQVNNVPEPIQPVQGDNSENNEPEERIGKELVPEVVNNEPIVSMVVQEDITEQAVVQPSNSDLENVSGVVENNVEQQTNTDIPVEAQVQGTSTEEPIDNVNENVQVNTLPPIPQSPLARALYEDQNSKSFTPDSSPLVQEPVVLLMVPPVSVEVLSAPLVVEDQVPEVNNENQEVSNQVGEQIENIPQENVPVSSLPTQEQVVEVNEDIVNVPAVNSIPLAELNPVLPPASIVQPVLEGEGVNLETISIRRR